MLRSRNDQSSNKKRLYIAFYTAAQSTLENYHSALLLTPKRPKPTKFQAWRYHAQENDGDSGSAGRWKYDACRVRNDGRSLVDLETDGLRLVALLHVCKVNFRSTEIGFSLLLKEVDVKEGWEPGGDRDWVRDAIELLVERDVIGAVEIGIATVWGNGHRFAQSVEGCRQGRVPTCDLRGEKMKSEVVSL
ncbi:hypothetical protein JAAARDRAFT_31471 [Jaapia argillacea MUCL 33604]|uniref:Uncharacterized protein n=1 Tax=Jaapia argillacea MUCL 33604 TaxID=933084 RepID=A0A067Q759_9AGAM|nr:hypothetical protein JAAARDRAFT_31471 [Jaapia argillacea MUCL 33604]